MTSSADAFADRIVAALVGGPVRAVFAGAVLLWAIGRWLGWWWTAAIAVAGIGDAIWCAARLPARWRR
jgi:hypothetical protein